MEQQIADFFKTETGIELIKSILKENLTIDVSVEGGDYGSSKFLNISLKLGGETISSETTYLD